jgi:hypothetical protein
MHLIHDTIYILFAVFYVFAFIQLMSSELDVGIKVDIALKSGVNPGS